MTPAHPRDLIRLLLFAALTLGLAGHAFAQSPPEEFRKSLERAVRSGAVQKSVCPGAPYCNPSSVTRFYQIRKYEPAWTREGTPLPVAEKTQPEADLTRRGKAVNSRVPKFPEAEAVVSTQALAPLVFAFFFAAGTVDAAVSDAGTADGALAGASDEVGSELELALALRS